MSSLESPESATDSDSPEGDLPFYYMTPSNQWGSYQSVAACPPPQIPYPFSPTPVHVPTPVYVTFSDGTTVVVPSHARPDPAQSASGCLLIISNVFLISPLGKKKLEINVFFFPFYSNSYVL